VIVSLVGVAPQGASSKQAFWKMLSFWRLHPNCKLIRAQARSPHGQLIKDSHANDGGITLQLEA